MSAVTSGVAAGDAGTVGGLANTASQVGGSIGLAVLATASGGDSDYSVVFLLAVGLAVAIAAISLLLPRTPR
jgi:hypothetical protein